MCHNIVTKFKDPIKTSLNKHFIMKRSQTKHYVPKQMRPNYLFIQIIHFVISEDISKAILE